MPRAAGATGRRGAGNVCHRDVLRRDAARADLERILEISLERWGDVGQMRYRAVLEAARHAIASDPEGPVTRDRGLLGAGPRSLHVRHARRAHGVHDPVHVIYYRWTRSALVEVVRIL